MEGIVQAQSNNLNERMNTIQEIQEVQEVQEVKKVKMTYLKNEQGDYVCPDCGKVVPKHRQSTMSMHMRKHLLEKEETTKHSCTHCSIPAFLTKAALDSHHMRLAGRNGHPVLTEALPLIECPFENCTFSDISKGNVRTHCMRSHVGEEVKAILERGEAKEIKCKNCSVEFKSLGSFYYHSIGCVSLSPTDIRHAVLAQLN